MITAQPTIPPSGAPLFPQVRFLRRPEQPCPPRPAGFRDPLFRSLRPDFSSIGTLHPELTLGVNLADQPFDLGNVTLALGFQVDTELPHLPL